MNAEVPYISQPLPPSVKEILSAYAAKGDGDRDVLLAILHAKAAEDQRIAALATLNDHVVLLQRQALEVSLHQHMLHQCQRPLEPSTSYSSNNPRSHNHAPPSPPISQAQSPSPRLPSCPGVSRKRKQSEHDGEALHRPQRSFDRGCGKSTVPISPFPITIPPSERSSCSPGPSSRRGSGPGASVPELTTLSSSRRPMDIHNMLGPPLSQSRSRLHPGPSMSPHTSLD